jgi:hypothetical protein
MNNSVSNNELNALRQWAVNETKKPRQSALAPGLVQTPWKSVTPQKSPYINTCNSCRRIR